MSDELGAWSPLAVSAVERLLRDAGFRWWFTGGIALELHVSSSWRGHGDVDVGICRRDARQLYEHLATAELFVAAAGQLRRWRGEELAEQASEKNIWVRSLDSGCWVLDIQVGDGDAESWIYRRDRKVRRPWQQAVLRTGGGVPYLAPELQLLFKSKTPRAKDDHDLRKVLPLLEPHRLRALLELLPAAHPWRDEVAAQARDSGAELTRATLLPP